MYDDKWIIKQQQTEIKRTDLHSNSNTFNLSDYHWVTKRKPYKLYVKVKAHRHTPCDHLFFVSVSLYRPLYACYTHATSSEYRKTKKNIKLVDGKMHVLHTIEHVLYIDNNTRTRTEHTYTYAMQICTATCKSTLCDCTTSRQTRSVYRVRVCLCVYVRLLILKAIEIRDWYGITSICGQKNATIK
jgi:hypothetical protein